MSAGKYRQANHLHVFLERRVHNHPRRLTKTRIHNLHSRVTEGSCDHLRAAVVSIEARFGNQYTNGEAHTDTASIINRRVRQMLERPGNGVRAPLPVTRNGAYFGSAKAPAGAQDNSPLRKQWVTHP